MTNGKLDVALLFDTVYPDAAKRKKIDSLAAIVHQYFNVVSVHQAERIIVIGGDGYITHCLREYAHLRIPFWGINCGTVGFLLNDFIDAEDLVSVVRDSEYIKFPLLHATIHFRDGKTAESLAFNDVWTATEPGQAAKHIIEVDGVNVIKKRFDSEIFIGNGIIIATPGGCTAYNIAAGGLPILAKDNIFGITPVCPTTPHKTVFHPFAIKNSSTVTIHMVEDDKRKHAVVADNVVFKKVDKVVIKRADDFVRVGFHKELNYYLKALSYFSLKPENGG